MIRNNLELRLLNKKTGSFGIVRIEENQYYNKQSDFEKVGEFYYEEHGYLIHESVFDNPTRNYSICHIENGVTYFLGDRAIELKTIEEMRDFLFLLRSGIKKSINYKKIK